VTWDRKKHARDEELLGVNPNFVNIFDFAKSHNFELLETSDVNAPTFVERLAQCDVDAIFSVSSRWIFTEHFITKMRGWVFNIHAGYLPNDRGSVVYPKILNNIKYAGATIHFVTPSVDGGPILLRAKERFASNKPSIDEVTAKNIKLSLDLLKQFLAKVENKKTFTTTPQDMNEGVYMPQPHTETNGYIDWSWKAEQIEAFVRAFGKPMLGAATFYKNKKIRVLDVSIVSCVTEYHPLYYGRIVGINDDGCARVITNSGILIIKKISENNVEVSPDFILKPPNILYTPMKILEEARLSTTTSLNMSLPDPK
jgi:methionyl-tRNA formyltransferase